MLGMDISEKRSVMKPSEVERMSTQEKLHAMEILWDMLDGEDVKTPEWHLDILKERKALIESGEAEFISLEVLKQYRF